MNGYARTVRSSPPGQLCALAFSVDFSLAAALKQPDDGSEPAVTLEPRLPPKRRTELVRGNLSGLTCPVWEPPVLLP